MPPFEGMSKLEKITYAHCAWMLSTELKYVPLTAMSKGFQIIFCLGPNDVPLIICGINEVKVRGSRTITIAVGAQLGVLPMPLLLYHMSVLCGFDPDFPRDLSKTLTVD